MKYVAFVIGAFVFSLNFVSAQRPAVGATIITSSGAMTGHAARNRTEVSEYWSISYAQPPVGDLLFAAPRTYYSLKVFAASVYVKHVGLDLY